MRKLECAAVKDKNESVHSCEGMARSHGEILLIMASKGLTTDDVVCGFLDSDGKFLTRPQAAKVAEEAGQILGVLRDPPRIYSDEVWW